MQLSKQYNYPAWLLFILAMGVWSFAIGGHELLGHGGVCAIDFGCDWLYADAMYFEGSRRNGFMMHLNRAGGSIFNFLFAIVAVLLLWRKPLINHLFRLVLWMSLTVNLFQSGSYIGFGWLIHPGMDWAKLSLLMPQAYGHIVVTLLGGIIITAGFVLSRCFYPAENNLKSKLKMLVIPLLGCAFVAITASIVMPTDDRVLMIQGGIGGSLGFLFWMIILAFLPMPRSRRSLEIVDTIQLTNSQEKPKLSLQTKLILLSILLTAFYLGVLTPGINFS